MGSQWIIAHESTSQNLIFFYVAIAGPIAILSTSCMYIFQPNSIPTVQYGVEKL